MLICPGWGLLEPRRECEGLALLGAAARRSNLTAVNPALHGFQGHACLFFHLLLGFWGLLLV